MSDGSNKGKSTKSLQDAIDDAGKNAAGPGSYTVQIELEVGNPKITEYKVTIVRR